MRFSRLALGAVLLLQVAFVFGSRELQGSNDGCSTPNCAQCKTPTGTCTKCDSGYKLQNDAGNVYCACEDPNCNLCTTTGRCTQCFLGYGPNAAGKCVACAAKNCASCLGSYKKCTECLAGYHVVGGKCERCSEGCTECTSDNKCIECDYGYQLQKSGTCLKCVDPNCRTCVGKGTRCTECAPTFGNVHGTCKPCTDVHCLTCNGNPAYCTSCRGNRYFSKDGKCVLP